MPIFEVKRPTLLPPDPDLNFPQSGGAPSAPTYGDVLEFSGDNAYPAGGTAGFEQLITDLTKSRRTVLGIVNLGTDIFIPFELRWNYRSKKLMAFDIATGVQAPPATDLSTHTFNVLVISW